ncbi:plasma membrane protein Pth11-like protein [Thozetella sp. PMI_491]|nr:plasma membrane protein Pth11-like protein [Thozetella sp. PMI_491]
MPLPTQSYYQTPGHLVAAAVILSVIDITAVVLRIFARKKQKQPFKADDWLMIPATVFTVGIAVDLIYGVAKQSLAYRFLLPDDFDGNTLELVTDQLVTTSKTEFVYILLLPLALGCIKASIVSFYLRIFSASTTGGVHKLLVALNILIFMWMTAFFFANLFQCRLDISAIWGSAVDLDTHCPGTMYIDLSLCITDFITDLFIIFVPIPPIWRLNLSTPKKIAASIVFLVGAVTVVASLIRLIMQIKVVQGGFDPEEDEILIITEYLYWGMVECGVGIFAACLPVVQVLGRKFSWAPVLQSVRSIFASKSAPSQHSNGSTHPVQLQHTSDVIYAGNDASSSHSTAVSSTRSADRDDPHGFKEIKAVV